jgi:hypothetical protein
MVATKASPPNRRISPNAFPSLFPRPSPTPRLRYDNEDDMNVQDAFGKLEGTWLREYEESKEKLRAMERRSSHQPRRQSNFATMLSILQEQDDTANGAVGGGGSGAQGGVGNARGGGGAKKGALKLQAVEIKRAMRSLHAMLPQVEDAGAAGDADGSGVGGSNGGDINGDLLRQEVEHLKGALATRDQELEELRGQLDAMAVEKQAAADAVTALAAGEAAAGGVAVGKVPGLKKLAGTSVH